MCSRGHVFKKSSDCPVCPKCWSGYYKKRLGAGLPSDLGAPALRALLNQKIDTLTKVAKHTEAYILSLHGLGPSAIPKLQRELKKQGLAFKK